MFSFSLKAACLFAYYVCNSNLPITVPGGTSGKEPACQYRRHEKPRFNPCVRKNPWRRAWQPTPVFLPGESHGQRSLAGYGLEGLKESQDWSDLAHMYTSLGATHSDLPGTFLVLKTKAPPPLSPFSPRQSWTVSPPRWTWSPGVARCVHRTF